jgi:hypothetical protein
LAFWVGRCSLSLIALKQREKSVFRRKKDCAAGLAFWVGRCSLPLTALEQREKSVLSRKTRRRSRINFLVW